MRDVERRGFGASPTRGQTGQGELAKGSSHYKRARTCSPSGGRRAGGRARELLQLVSPLSCSITLLVGRCGKTFEGLDTSQEHVLPSARRSVKSSVRAAAAPRVRADKRDAHPDTSRDRARTALTT